MLIEHYLYIDQNNSGFLNVCDATISLKGHHCTLRLESSRFQTSWVGTRLYSERGLARYWSKRKILIVRFLILSILILDKLILDADTDSKHPLGNCIDSSRCVYQEWANWKIWNYLGHVLKPLFEI